MVRTNQHWPATAEDCSERQQDRIEVRVPGPDLEDSTFDETDAARLNNELEQELFGLDPAHHEPYDTASDHGSRLAALGLRGRASQSGTGGRAAVQHAPGRDISRLHDADARLIAARLAPAREPDEFDPADLRGYDSWAAPAETAASRGPLRTTLLAAAAAVVIAGGGAVALLLPTVSGPPTADISTDMAAVAQPAVDTPGDPAPVPAVAAAPAQVRSLDTVSVATPAAVEPASAASMPAPVEPFVPDAPIAVPTEVITMAAEPVDDGAETNAEPSAGPAPEADLADVVADRWEVVASAEAPVPAAVPAPEPSAFLPASDPVPVPDAPDIMAYAPLSTVTAPELELPAPEAPAAEKPAPKAAAPAQDAPVNAGFAIAAAAPVVTAPATTGSTDSASTAGQAVVSDHVNMRAAPENGSAVVAVVPIGQQVTVLSCDQWCNVSYDGREGWVYRRFVKPTAE